MSLTLLPAVDVRDGKAVRLRQGESGSETDYGSPLEAARTWVELRIASVYVCIFLVKIRFLSGFCKCFPD